MRAPVFPPPSAPARRKRRRSWLLSFLGFGFAASVVLFLLGATGAGYLLWKASKDLPDYESLAKYEPPVMTRIHAHDGSLISEYARERRIYVPINTIPKQVDRRLPLGRGPALLRARRARFPGHRARRLQDRRSQDEGRRPPRRGRLHHHAAGRQELPADQRPHRRAQDQGGDPRHPHRARLLQGQDPRALPQRDLPRHRPLRRAPPASTISTRS